MHQREPRIVVHKLTDSAHGQECTVRVPEACIGGTEATVAAHWNWAPFKGVGLKADDLAVAFACSACHAWIDDARNPIDERIRLWTVGHLRTLRVWWEDGVLR